MGYETAPLPEQCATTAKTSEWQRAGHKKRGSRGQGPRRSFLWLSPEKAGLPPGAGRETTLQAWACAGSPPDSGREPGFLQRKPEERAPGAMPPGPPFLWPARWHSLVLALGGALSRSLDYFGTHLRALIWRLSFPKMLFSIFYPENASQIGFSIPEEIAPQPYQSQQSPNPASGNERP